MGREGACLDSADDAVAQMGDGRGVDDFDDLQVNGLGEMVEEADALTEQNGGEFDVNFIEQTGGDHLPDDGGAADGDGFACGDGLCLR